MKILHTSIHRINHHDSSVQLLNKFEGDDIDEYLEKLFEDIRSDKSKRRFIFRSNTTEVRSQLSKMLNNEFDEAANIIADRLLPIEVKVQEKIEKLGTEIQQGSFIQIVVDDGTYYRVIISKADHLDFLDEKDGYRTHSGLPKKKKIYKAILINFTQKKELDEIFVYDTVKPISQYWWDSFLELEEVYTDEENSRKSFEALDSVIFRRMKKKYPADHTYLRNAAITFFRNHDEFDLEEFLNSTFRSYIPHDPNLPVNDYISKIESLPETKNFDPRFTVKVNEIKARLKTDKINLHAGLDLHLTGVENIEDVIMPGLEDDRRKYIKIYSDSGYEHFK